MFLQGNLIAAMRTSAPQGAEGSTSGMALWQEVLQSHQANLVEVQDDLGTAKAELDVLRGQLEAAHLGNAELVAAQQGVEAAEAEAQVLKERLNAAELRNQHLEGAQRNSEEARNELQVSQEDVRNQQLEALQLQSAELESAGPWLDGSRLTGWEDAQSDGYVECKDGAGVPESWGTACLEVDGVQERRGEALNGSPRLEVSQAAGSENAAVVTEGVEVQARGAEGTPTDRFGEASAEPQGAAERDVSGNGGPGAGLPKGRETLEPYTTWSKAWQALHTSGPAQASLQECAEVGADANSGQSALHAMGVAEIQSFGCSKAAEQVKDCGPLVQPSARSCTRPVNNLFPDSSALAPQLSGQNLALGSTVRRAVSCSGGVLVPQKRCRSILDNTSAPQRHRSTGAGGAPLTSLGRGAEAATVSVSQEPRVRRHTADVAMGLGRRADSNVTTTHVVNNVTVSWGKQPDAFEGSGILGGAASAAPPAAASAASGAPGGLEGKQSSSLGVHNGTTSTSAALAAAASLTGMPTWLGQDGLQVGTDPLISSSSESGASTRGGSREGQPSAQDLGAGTSAIAEQSGHGGDLCKLRAENEALQQKAAESQARCEAALERARQLEAELLDTNERVKHQIEHVLDAYGSLVGEGNLKEEVGCIPAHSPAAVDVVDDKLMYGRLVLL
jgi:vacuolar-type H+-ATPase subunit E/Vma4